MGIELETYLLQGPVLKCSAMWRTTVLVLAFSSVGPTSQMCQHSVLCSSNADAGSQES
jgi:hypothetical protein